MRSDGRQLWSTAPARRQNAEVRPGSGRSKKQTACRSTVCDKALTVAAGHSAASGLAEHHLEWQIEWQSVLASACPGLADAGLGSRSSWSAA